VIYCTKCGSSLQQTHEYCWKCGAKAESSWLPSIATHTTQSHGPSPHRKFGQLFGLDPRVAFLTLIVDAMLNAGDVATLGLLLPMSIGAGIVLGYIVYKAQINWYGDDKESARIKAFVLGLLTAIPTPIPEILYIPAGLIGLFHKFREKGFSYLNLLR
jgi:hypothetical protein